MKNRLMFLAILIAQLSYYCYAQKSSSIILNLKEKPVTSHFTGINYRSFNPKRHIFPVQEKQAVQLPKQQEDLLVLHSYFDRNQFFYQSYKAGDIAPQLYFQMDDIDTTTLTPAWVDGIVTIAIGEDQQGQLFLIVDQNNDENLANDEQKYLQKQTKEDAAGIFVAQVDVTFEYFENGKINQRTIPVAFTLRNKEDKTEIDWHVSTYKKTTWQMDDTAYDIALPANPVYHSGQYDFIYIDVNRDGYFDTNRSSSEAYSINVPFNLGGKSWEITNLALDGSLLEISQINKVVAPKSSLEAGAQAPAFMATTLQNKTLISKTLPGQYFLLNFWASWCPYCKAEIHYLKAARENFDNHELLILGVAFDENFEVVQQIIEKEQIKWMQANQQSSKELIETFRVLSYPTLYLLDPSGKIVATGEALRGRNLEKTLSSYIK